MTKAINMTYENNVFYCTKNGTKWISIDGEKWYGEEKRIAELEELLINSKNLSDTIEKAQKKKIAELEKELKNWKDEWQEQVQKATEEGYARTKQTIQLSKVKELLELFVQWNYGCCKEPDYKNLVKQAEQFLNSEL